MKWQVPQVRRPSRWCRLLRGASASRSRDVPEKLADDLSGKGIRQDLECSLGEKAQVDFGTGAPIVTPDGRRRKTYVFRIVLSHSREGYSQTTFTQTTDDFLHALENAFAHSSGV